MKPTENFGGGKEGLFANKKGVSHYLVKRVWSKDRKYSYMLLLCVSVSKFIL